MAAGGRHNNEYADDPLFHSSIHDMRQVSAMIAFLSTLWESRSMAHHNEIVRESFTAQAKAFAANPWVTDKQRIRRLVAAARLTGNERVLDIATGPGYIAEAFARAAVHGRALRPARPDSFRYLAAPGYGRVSRILAVTAIGRRWSAGGPSSPRHRTRLQSGERGDCAR